MKSFPNVFSKKTAWSLLILFFIFDSVVSYFAITKMNGREANLMIAFLVEKYPILYFIYIPGLIIIMHLIVLGFTKLAIKFFNKNNLKKELVEKVVLTSVVIYWPIANSYMNLSFILGHRLTIPAWYFLSGVGFFSALTYFVFTINSKKLA
ncbi:hypothetical protein HZA76_02565 [Candidatus Roizmanbacteria bacterium]|nr:hypothetical protein [Candidatus Roizmanbacteria bacterium]